MSPSHFVERYRATLSSVPADIAKELRAFSTYDRRVVERLPIGREDKNILVESGLPDEAAPFLTLGGPQFGRLPLASTFVHGDQQFNRYRAIGTNGSGDAVCIDVHDGSAVYLNHANAMSRTTVNSNVSALAESLCVYAELRNANGLPTLLSELRRVDPAAVIDGTFWASEAKT